MGDLLKSIITGGNIIVINNNVIYKALIYLEYGSPQRCKNTSQMILDGGSYRGSYGVVIMILKRIHSVQPSVGRHL